MTQRVPVSIIIPTRDRRAAIEATLITLFDACEIPESAEVLVVDDGSGPPLELPARPGLRLLRLEEQGRSTARNVGGRCGADGILLFLDDDMSVAPGFLEAHVRAQAEWPGALAVGSVRLREEALSTPFGRFRQRLEDAGCPAQRGVTTSRCFCAAGNMSILRARFLELGGFDPELSSGEDQDLALRHSSDGGLIAFIPEARAIHRDEALDIRSYCRRVEIGSEHDVAFVRKQSDSPDNRHRKRINGPVAYGREPLRISIVKVFKTIFGLRLLQEALFLTTALLERVAPDSAALDRLYRILLGIHIRRGYMRGLRGLRALPSG